ncbi:MAG: PKD domain-containing protein [Bacteroidia bacterium]|nr:PKD domain-containing protein [Bacteroidia bacterium]
MLEFNSADFFANFNVYYYKPTNYNFVNSPILLHIHGLGGSGANISNLTDIADRRGALLIGPTMDTHSDWPYAYTRTDSCWYFYWYVPVIKQLYKHVLLRESRNNIPVYLTGFSAGGQFVTRYMLIRQGIPDSIPIKMAVSVNPASYTFCTDSLNGIEMPYPCGISRDSIISGSLCSGLQTWYLPFECNEHVIQYYNENYGVLIGTADTVNFNPGWTCMDVQGSDRYERARNFYNFSTNDAIARGTTLQWIYDSIVGIAHDGYWMYNTKRNVTDSSTIAETLLFDTPYHPVPQLTPVASFVASDTVVILPNAFVLFSNQSINAVSYLWDFGDGSLQSSESSPVHIYQDSGYYSVTLISCNTCGWCDTLVKQNLIEVKNQNTVNEIYSENFNLQIFPNPFTDKTNFSFFLREPALVTLEITNYLGQTVATLYNEYFTSNEAHTIEFDSKGLNAGIYYCILRSPDFMEFRKLVIIK